MSLTAWSIIWQTVIAVTCVALFALAAYISIGAIRDLRDMFRELGEEEKKR